MGLFAKFRSESDPTMTPQLAFAGLLVAVSGSTLSEAELRFLGSILTGPAAEHSLVDPSAVQEILADARRLIERSSFDEFLVKATPVLSETQRLAVLINLMDLCLVDGSVLEGERLVFERIREAFRVPAEKLRPYVDMLTLKNDPSIRPSVIAPHLAQAAEAFRSLV